MNQAERRIRLINALLNERADGRGIAVPAGAGEQRDLLRALMNVRSPEALATEVLNVQDVYLQQRLVERGGATDASTLPYRNRIAVWRGDITLLKADAIVNAANSQNKPGPREELLLRRCYTSCLEEATRRKLDTLAFCCISTGVFGYPQQAAARVAIDAVRHHLDHNDPNLKVIFNVFLASDESIYRDLLQADR